LNLHDIMIRYPSRYKSETFQIHIWSITRKSSYSPFEFWWQQEITI
jgi:hypothetical protein